MSCPTAATKKALNLDFEVSDACDAKVGIRPRFGARLGRQGFLTQCDRLFPKGPSTKIQNMYPKP